MYLNSAVGLGFQYPVCKNLIIKEYYRNIVFSGLNQGHKSKIWVIYMSNKFSLFAISTAKRANAKCIKLLIQNQNT